jgi:Xaa-Pro aminopeptidase
MATDEQTPATANRSTTPISEAFRDFIQTGWDYAPAPTPEAFEHANLTAVRRQKLSKAFPGITLVIPAGDHKQRSNDTDYPFRPHTAFTYMSGWGAACTPGSILLGTPSEEGHHWRLYLRPPAPRTSDEFYANASLGEFWTGPRPQLETVATQLGMETADLAQWPDTLKSLGEAAVIREADSVITAALDGIRSTETEPQDARLAQEISEARLVKDSFEVSEMRRAVAATHRGFNDIVHALPRAIGHERGERIIEGVFHQRARLEGNDTGYGTIAASGPHACILHWVDNDGPVQQGDLLLVDAGVELDTLYTADITRTLPVGGTFSEIQRRVYEAVLEAADHAFSLVKPGIKFRDVHDGAMQVIAHRVASWGFLPVSPEESLTPEGQQHRRYMIHGTSHHLGLDVHDCAQARREMYMEKELEPGMVFTIEPGLYFQPDDTTVPPEWRGIGVRIEDNILVTQTGAENLSANIPRTPAEVENWVGNARSSLD